MTKTYDIKDATRRKPSKKKSGSTAKGRRPFTTMIRPQLRDALDNAAHNNNCSLADVLETLITEYFDLTIPD